MIDYIGFWIAKLKHPFGSSHNYYANTREARELPLSHLRVKALENEYNKVDGDMKFIFHTHFNIHYGNAEA